MKEKVRKKIKDTGVINPLFIEILDETVEPKVANNPIVDVEDIDDSNYFQ